MRPGARSRLRVGAGLALAALLALPSAASAKDGLDLMVRFPAGNGYTISVGGYEATAFIGASRSAGTPRDRSVSSTYVARGKVTPTSLEADFGSFGHASLRFKPSSRVIQTKPQQHCIGPDHYTIRSGVYVGSVRFRGEGGYASASVKRIKGKEITPAQLRCFGSIASILRELGYAPNPVKKRPKVTKLVAGWREAVSATTLEVSRKRDATRFFAATQHTEGQLAIYRTAYAKAPSAAFTANGPLSSASLTPPAPFSGSGSFQRGPQGSKLWTGSLSVSFPGASHIPLTGPQFKTQLTRSW
ncbi:MAG: hypothetical protein ACRDLL_05760 [Solirubrobacterales bacterium]